jgi:hypothetical protein
MTATRGPRRHAMGKPSLGWRFTPSSPPNPRFSPARPTAFGAAPNSQACAIDLGLPGVLPVLNAEAVRLAVRFGKAIEAEIAERSVFARKNYFYPDLPKGYQISQYEQPVVGRGQVHIRLDDGTLKEIGVTRAHLEEDAGKSLHEDFHGLTGIDLNRAGTPLLEIVSEPDMRSPEEAVAYAPQDPPDRALDRHQRRQHAGRLLPHGCQHLPPPPGHGHLGHPRRNQEHQLLPLSGPGPALRNRAPERHPGERRQGGPGDPPLRRRPGRDPLHAQQGGGQ